MNFDSKQLKEMSNAVRAGALYAVRSAHSGHVGIALGASDIITTIYANYLRRGIDRFVLSAGHGSALLYSILKLVGYKIQSLKTFRKIDGLPGHPELGTDGVDATTGPLGQGLANAVGMALAKKIRNARTIKKADRSKIYCLCSDGDLMEGVAQEAIGFAGRYQLDNIIVLWDDNRTSIDGTALTDVNIPARMAAAAWNVLSINGNNFNEINDALTKAIKSSKPVFIQCQTVIGLGSSVAGTATAHGYGVSDTELLMLEEKLTSAAGLKLWGKVAKHTIPADAKPADTDLIVQWPDIPDGDVSTRELSGKLLEQLAAVDSRLIGGSADLAGSTMTKTPAHRDIMPGDFRGNFINYGVREHAMAAIMNGLCHMGFRPYGGTFLIFSDYMRPAIRLSAISKLPVIYVFTHDSVAVGEDGATHQPVEQMASLRLIPNMNVFRPCNLSEIIACWEMALVETSRPSCIILSRQKFKQIETENLDDIQKGGYIIRSSEFKRPKITLIATGSEVPLAVQVAKKLKGAQVVSMPSVEKFRAQSARYKQRVLQGYTVAIEAGATAGWFEFADAVMGIDNFGLSGPGADVYKQFGFDVDILVGEINKKIK